MGSNVHPVSIGQVHGPLNVGFVECLDNRQGLTQDLQTDELEVEFARISQEMSVRARVSFRIIVEGQPRKLHPVVRDAAYRIVREALVNAFRHSDAKHVEVELAYSATGLRVAVRDNGKGIIPELLHSRRDDHRGLSGMQARARRIGAKLRLSSRVGTGTEVDLSMPANVAFSTPRKPRRFGWWQVLRLEA
jgi:signal transduction histidine kinase